MFCQNFLLARIDKPLQETMFRPSVSSKHLYQDSFCVSSSGSKITSFLCSCCQTRWHWLPDIWYLINSIRCQRGLNISIWVPDQTKKVSVRSKGERSGFGKAIKFDTNRKYVDFFHPDYSFIIDYWFYQWQDPPPTPAPPASFLVASPALHYTNYLTAACFSSCWTWAQSASDTPRTTARVQHNTKPAISIKGVGNCWVLGDKYKQIHPEKEEN